MIGIATLVIVVAAPSDKEGEVASQARPAKQRTNNQVAPAPAADRQRPLVVGHVELERLTRPAMPKNLEKSVGDAFNTTTWYIPPPPPKYIPDDTPPPPPPPPTAPPLPFTFVGRYSDAGSQMIILAKGDRIYTVAEGDVIENTYRVEKLTSGKINLTYLPLNIAQSLRTGDSL
jgi:hypothetical protein